MVEAFLFRKKELKFFDFLQKRHKDFKCWGEKMVTVTKKELVHKISHKLNVHPNGVRNVIQAFLDEVMECLSKGDRLEFRDFGILEIVKRKAKIGRNPKKSEVPIVIPERSAVKFTPSKKMKKKVQQLPVSIK
jgi:integration host factor subunit beta